MDEPGGRYIDFLVPGLLGMSLMGGGLWGVGFVIVDMRIRKVLKRFLATPMRKSDFLASVLLSRLLFMITEMVVLLLFGCFPLLCGCLLLAVHILVEHFLSPQNRGCYHRSRLPPLMSSDLLRVLPSTR